MYMDWTDKTLYTITRILTYIHELLDFAGL